MTGRRGKKRSEIRMIMDSLVMVLQIGIYMLVPIFLCTMAGVWIGGRTGMTWITVPLFFLGAAAGGNNVYRTVKKMIKNMDK